MILSNKKKLMIGVIIYSAGIIITILLIVFLGSDISTSTSVGTNTPSLNSTAYYFSKDQIIKILSPVISVLSLTTSIFVLFLTQPGPSNIMISSKSILYTKDQTKFHIYPFNFGRLPGRIKINNIYLCKVLKKRKIFYHKEYEKVEHSNTDYTSPFLIPPMNDAIIEFTIDSTNKKILTDPEYNFYMYVKYHRISEGKEGREVLHKIRLIKGDNQI